MFFLARLTQDRGRQLIESEKTTEGYSWFVAAAERMQELRKKYEKLTPAEQEFLAIALYNAACAHSLRGEANQALSWLEVAFEAGSRH